MPLATIRSGLLIVLLAASTWVSSAYADGCPTDIRAAIAQACPCAGFRNHGKFMGCVRQQITVLRQAGCDEQHLKSAVNCANSSICGKAHNPIVCCTKAGRPKLTSAKACSDRSGQVMTGATGTCDASCPTRAPK